MGKIHWKYTRGDTIARLSVKRIDEALRASRGNITYAAKALGCSRSTVYSWVKKSPVLQRTLHDEREGAIDIAESALQRAVLNGEAWAVSLTLKTIGRHRGYVERVETSDDSSLEDLITVIKQMREDMQSGD